MSTHGLITVSCSERLHRAHVVRCAFCHGALESDDSETSTCPACRTKLHKECVDDLGRCPTLGCVRRLQARPRSRIFVGSGEPSPWRIRWRLLFGILLPLAAFLLSEAGLSRALASSWSDGGARSWWRLAYLPAVQRPLYPLLLWAVVSYLAALNGSRSRWVLTGLLGGALLSGAFSLLFLPALPLSLVTCLIGIGFLGLSPYFAVTVYSSAFARVLRARREADDEPEPVGSRVKPWVVWLMFAAVGVQVAGEQILALHADLARF